MKKLSNMIMVCVFAHLFVDACQFYIVNDVNYSVTVYDAELEQCFEIAPKRKQLVGDPHKHAHCRVFRKGKPNKIGEFRMIACATPGMSTDVSIQDMLDGSVPAIFDLVYTNGKGSMVKPSSSGCSSCQARHANK